MVVIAMQAVSRWIDTTPDAGTKVAVAVASALGKVLGDEAATLVSFAGSPRRLGEELGDPAATRPSRSRCWCWVSEESTWAY